MMDTWKQQSLANSKNVEPKKKKLGIDGESNKMMHAASILQSKQLPQMTF